MQGISLACREVEMFRLTRLICFLAVTNNFG